MAEERNQLNKRRLTQQDSEIKTKTNLIPLNMFKN